jgi:ceramide glucosyltransferase
MDHLQFPVVSLVIAAGVLTSLLYYGTAIWSARRFFARCSDGSVDDWPEVTILKPLKGVDVELYENLASFCHQKYPSPYQIVFGVADPDDPAIAVVRRLQCEFPSLALDLVIDGRVYGTNYKVSNLHNMYEHARHQVLVISDSDIRVTPDYLRGVVAPLRHPSVGVVSCLYKAVCRGGLPTVIESLFINTDFAAMVMVARIVEKPSYAFGATMALRRETLDAIGGFLPIVNYLADDYCLGNSISQRGLQSVLADLVVETVLDVGRWKRLLQHQLRWARTYRTMRPGGYFASVLTHGTLWVTLLLLHQGLTPASVAIAAGVIGVRLWGAATMCFVYLRTDNRWWHLLLVPLKDLLVSAVWLLSFLGNRVRWSGRDFRVRLNGTMDPLEYSRASRHESSSLSEPNPPLHDHS